MTSQCLWTPTQVFHPWQGAVNEWWIAPEQSAVVQHNKTVDADMFTLQSRTLPLPRPKSADKWSLHGTEMPRRCVLDCEIDGQRVGGWLKSRNGQMVVCWDVIRCLHMQTGCRQVSLAPLGRLTHLAVSIRKVWGHFMSTSIRETQYKALRFLQWGSSNFLRPRTPWWI